MDAFIFTAISIEKTWYDLGRFWPPFKGQGSRRVKIGPVSKIDETLLYNVCMSSVTENDLFLKSGFLLRHL